MGPARGAVTVVGPTVGMLPDRFSRARRSARSIRITDRTASST